MAVVALFWHTNVVNVTSCANKKKRNATYREADKCYVFKHVLAKHVRKCLLLSYMKRDLGQGKARAAKHLTVEVKIPD